MDVKQIHTILNDVMEEVAGESALVAEDLSNIVDLGTTVFSNNWKDAYCKSMINRIGRMVFVDRKYSGYAPNILKDSFEYGSILAKSRCKIFEAKANPSWQLTSGQTVNQFEFNAPEVVEKFYNTKVAWQIDCSFTDVQIKQSFVNVTEMNNFISMIQNRIETSMTIFRDSLIMRTINAFTAEKIHANNGVVHLLTDYNTMAGTTLTADKAIANKEFLRYAAQMIDIYRRRISAPSVLFNTDNENVTFTPDSDQMLVMLDNFASGLKVYLESDTYHNELVATGNYSTVPYWQGSGTSYALSDCSTINAKLASDSSVEVEEDNIVAVLFDKEAMGVVNQNLRTTTSYNANGEYYNNFYKCDSSYFIDLLENGIIFVID